MEDRTMTVSADIKYVGVNDHEIDLFEGQYVVPNGMAYNSYVIMDDKIAVMDTVDKSTACLEVSAITILAPTISVIPLLTSSTLLNFLVADFSTMDLGDFVLFLISNIGLE